MYTKQTKTLPISQTRDYTWLNQSLQKTELPQPLSCRWKCFSSQPPKSICYKKSTLWSDPGPTTNVQMGYLQNKYTQNQCGTLQHTPDQMHSRVQNKCTVQMSNSTPQCQIYRVELVDKWSTTKNAQSAAAYSVPVWSRCLCNPQSAAETIPYQY